MTSNAYPTAPPVEGVNFRHAVLPDDLVTMNEVANRARRAEGVEWVTSDEAFRTYYENLANCDPATDLVIAERDGTMVGYGRASWREEVDGDRIYDVTVLALPDHATQVMDPLHEAVEGRLRKVAAEHAPGTKHFEVESSDAATIRNAVLEARGYQPVRFSFYMLRSSLDDLPDAPMPDGLEVRPVTPDQLRQIFDADVEAFRDHWAPRCRRRRTSASSSPTRCRGTRRSGRWPGTATRWRAWCAATSTRMRTRCSGVGAASSKTSAPVARTVGADWPAR